MNRRQIAMLICILFLAGVLRAGTIIHRASAPLAGDEPSYDSIAWSVATGHGYRVIYPGSTTSVPTALRGPTYVLLVALVYWIAGHSHTAVFILQILQALLDMICCLLAYKIAYILFRRVDVALLSALLHAIYPQFILFSAQIMTETIVTTLLMVGIAGFLYQAIEGRQFGLYAGGIALGLGALSKPILAIVPILFYVAILVGTPHKARIRSLLLQLLIVGLIMTPWIVRNYMVFHAFIPGVTTGGMTFWHGVDPPELDGSFTPERVKAALRGVTEPEAEKWYYRDAMRIIRSDLKRYLLFQPKKVVRLWFNLMYDHHPSRSSILLAIYHFGAIVLALIGIRALRPPRVASAFLGFLILLFTAVHLVFDAVVRLSSPAWAYIFPFTAAGLLVVWTSASLPGFRRHVVDNKGASA